MKISATIAALCLYQASAFTVRPNIAPRVSAVKPLQYGWDAVNKAAPAAPAAPPAAPAPPAAAAPPAPPAAEEVDDAAPAAGSWGTEYDPSKDVIPEPPAGARSWDVIFSEFQAKKAAGGFNSFKNVA
mmetsp:Transcript_14911/g.21093  ORF Transcript_14911/g.21093 Transcript_14911/m.21093 type:complete len:128 (-) Transcript_14911:256-639(-)